jgi:hypothetical protein
MFLFEEIVIPPSITAVDIGAMLLEEHTDPMARLCQLGLLRVIGFEPQPTECEKLNALDQPKLSGRFDHQQRQEIRHHPGIFW